MLLLVPYVVPIRCDAALALIQHSVDGVGDSIEWLIRCKFMSDGLWFASDVAAVQDAKPSSVQHYHLNFYVFSSISNDVDSSL